MPKGTQEMEAGLPAGEEQGGAGGGMESLQQEFFKDSKVAPGQRCGGKRKPRLHRVPSSAERYLLAKEAREGR